MNCVSVFLLRFVALVVVFGMSAAAGRERSPNAANTFRWIHPTSDPQLWEQILSSFSGELRPDEPKQGIDEFDIYRYKYLQKVGVLNHSALVVVGHRPAKEIKPETAWNEYYSVFSFDSARDNFHRSNTIACGNGNFTSWRDSGLHLRPISLSPI